MNGTPEQPPTTLTIGQALELTAERLRRNDADGALDLSRRILAAVPGQPQASALAADAAFATGRQRAGGGDHAGALAAYRRGAALAPERPFVHHFTGEALLALGRLNDASRCYERALRLDPQDAPSATRLADVQAVLGLWDRCEAAARHALRLTPQVGMLHYLLSLSCHRLERPREALEAIGQALALDGPRGAYEYQRGLALRDLGEIGLALDAFRNAARLNPERHDAHFNAAQCASLLGRPIDALPENLALARQAAAEATAAEVAGDLRRAAERYAAALAACPSEPDYAEALHRVLDAWKARLDDEAIPFAERNNDWVLVECWRAEAVYRPLLLAHPEYSGIPGTAPARAAGRRRVWDCFMFFNELDLLEIRLNELSGVVDTFVIVESTLTHQGRPKELLFWNNRERFAAFADRIVHVVADERREGLPWEQESYQRKCILKGLEGAADDDLVLVCDLDEIPRHQVIRRIAEDDALASRLNVLSLVNFNYFLNFASFQPFIRPVVLPFGLARRLGVNLARHVPLRTGQQIAPVLYDAGWHFSWLGGVDAIWKKFENFCHIDLLGPAPTREALQAKLDAGDFQFLKREVEGRFVAIDGSFPDHVRGNLEAMRRLGWIWTPRAARPDGG